MNCIDFFYGRSVNRNKIHEPNRIKCTLKESTYLKLGGLDHSLGSFFYQCGVPVSCDSEQGTSSRWASVSPSVKQGAWSRWWWRSSHLHSPKPLSNGLPLYRSCQRVGAISCFKYKIGLSIIYAHLIAYERPFCYKAFSGFMDLITVMSCF